MSTRSGWASCSRNRRVADGAESSCVWASGRGRLARLRGPDARVGFGYAMNQMGTDPLLDPRARRLFEALYAAL